MKKNAYAFNFPAVSLDELTVILSVEFCISMFVNLYIARPTYRFILIYTCGLTAVIKRICYYVIQYSKLVYENLHSKAFLLNALRSEFADWNT